MLHPHGGDVFGAAIEAGLTPSDILDFSSNVNLCLMPDTVRVVLQESANLVGRYADPSARGLRSAAASAFGVAEDAVIAGNGSTELLYAAPRAMRPRRVIVLAPCYHDYWRAAEHAGAEAEGVLSSDDKEFVPNIEQLEMRMSGADMLFLGNPNNPTGVVFPVDSIRALATTFPHVTIVVDESFVEFVPESVGASLVSPALPENIVVLRSTSLFYGLPGLRLGFMVASPDICRQVERVREPWPVNAIAQKAGEALLQSEIDVAAIRQSVIAERERVRDELSRVAGLRVFHSQANFLLLRITKPGLTSHVLCQRMLEQRILIRNTAGFRGLNSRFVRVSIRNAEENDQLIQGIQAALDSSRWKKVEARVGGYAV